MDNRKLINEVFVRPCLWDMRSKDHNKRQISRRLWNEVAISMNFDCESVKKRWKCLKDNYREELKKLRNNSAPGCSTSPANFTKWKYFKQLNFLRPILNKGEPEDSFLFEESTGIESSIVENDSINAEDHVYICDMASFQPSIDQVNENANETLKEKTTEDTPNCNTRTRKSSRTKRKCNEIENKLLELEYEKLKILREEKDLKSNGDYNFLLSFLPHLKTMSELSKLKFRNKISALLFEIKQEDLNQSKSPELMETIFLTNQKIRKRSTEPERETFFIQSVHSLEEPDDKTEIFRRAWPEKFGKLSTSGQKDPLSNETMDNLQGNEDEAEISSRVQPIQDVKISIQSDKNIESNQSEDNIQRTENEAEIFSKAWAIQFRNLVPDQQLCVKKRIDDILFKGCLGNLAPT